MHIRKATYMDAPEIRTLLEALGYNTTISMVADQLEVLFNKDGHEVFVCDFRGEVVGFASVHYLPQLAFDGGLMIITYFSVDADLKEIKIAKELEQYITNYARSKDCERIQVHCLDWRTPAHKFYLQQGYQEYPKYFTKKLVYAE